MIARIKREHPELDFTSQREADMFLQREYSGCLPGHYEYFYQQWRALKGEE